MLLHPCVSKIKILGGGNLGGGGREKREGRRVSVCQSLFICTCTQFVLKCYGAMCMYMYIPGLLDIVTQIIFCAKIVFEDIP